MSANKDKLVGSLAIVGAALMLLTFALFVVGIWSDWRWAATAVIPGGLMVAAFKAAWILS